MASQFAVSQDSSQILRANAVKGSAAYNGQMCHQVLAMSLTQSISLNLQALRRGIQIYGIVSVMDRKVIDRVKEISKKFDKIYTQLPFYWNSITREAGVIEKYSDAKYGVSLVGTADFVFVSDDRLFIGDWKTGFDAIDPPDSNLQLAALAEMASRHFKIDRSRVAVCIANPVLGQIEIAQPLKLEAQQLTYDFINSIKDKAIPGPACRYCPAKSECPEFAKDVMSELEKINEFI